MNTTLRIIKGTCVLIEIRDTTIYGYELLSYKYLQYPLLMWFFVWKNTTYIKFKHYMNLSNNTIEIVLSSHDVHFSGHHEPGAHIYSTD